MMTNQQVFFKLDRVECGDETGGMFVEKVGNGEISLSGFGIDANGTAFMLEPFEIYAHFDDGETKKYDPAKTLFTLDVPDVGAFPKTCAVGLILAETADGVGHREVTQKAFAKLTELMKAKKQKLMESSVNPISINWENVWEKASVVLYGYVNTSIESGINDDVFPLKCASV